MKVALVEPNLTGHRITYLKHYIQSFVKAGHSVWVFCPDNAELKDGMDQGLLDRVHFIPFNLKNRNYRFFQSTRNTLACWKRISQKIKKSVNEVDGVFFMSLDTFNATFYNTLTFLGIKLHKYLNRWIPRYIDSVFPFQWGGIYLTPNLERVHIFKSGNNVLIGILESASAFPDEDLNRRVASIPDITDVRIDNHHTDLEKAIIEKAAGRTIVSLLGRIHKRKGVLTLLETAEKMSGENYFFVFAGEPALNSFSPDQKRRIDHIKKNPPENCLFHFERLEDGHEFNSLVRVSDILFAAYINFPFSSNLLTKAACFKKPVIVSERGYMKQVVEKNKMGVTIKEGEVSECIHAIKELNDSFSFEDASFDEYYSGNSVESIEQVVNEFEKKIHKALQRK